MGNKTLDAVFDSLEPEKFKDSIEITEVTDADYIADPLEDDLSSLEGTSTKNKENIDDKLSSLGSEKKSFEDTGSQLPVKTDNVIQDAIDLLNPPSYSSQNSVIALNNISGFAENLYSSIDQLVIEYDRIEKRKDDSFLNKFFFRFSSSQPMMTKEQLLSEMEARLIDTQHFYTALIKEVEQISQKSNDHYNVIAECIKNGSTKLKTKKESISEYTQNLKKINQVLEDEFIGREIDYEDSDRINRFHNLKRLKMENERKLTGDLNDYLVVIGELKDLKDEAAKKMYDIKVCDLLNLSYNKILSESKYALERSQRERSVNESLAKSANISSILYGTLSTVKNMQNKVHNDYREELHSSLQNYFQAKKKNELEKTSRKTNIDNYKNILAQGRDSMTSQISSGNDVYE